MTRFDVPITYRRTALLALTALGVAGAPLGAQVAGSRVRVSRDSASVVSERAVHAERMARLRATIDSLVQRVRSEPISGDEQQRIARHLAENMASLEALIRGMDRELDSRMSTATLRALRERDRVSGFRIELDDEGKTRVLTSPFKGWIGITAEGVQFRPRIVDGEVYIRYGDYPEIITVEPNSPAERVGIAKGDVLVAYDGMDVREQDINLTKLLVPYRRLRVTVEREGDRRNFDLRVAEAPRHLLERRTEFGLMQPGVAPRMTRVPPPPRGDGPPLPPEPGAVVITRRGDEATAFTFRTFADGLAGAQATTIESELGESFGVGHGVLLLKVGPGTPAHASGLRTGDVIVKASGRDVRTLMALRRAMAQADNERRLQLEVVRRKKPVTVELKW